MQLIWDTLVYKVFRFECACAKEGKANEVALSRRLIRFLSLTKTYQSMGVDGFDRTQYLQLALDIRCRNPPPPPSLIIKLPLSPLTRRHGLANTASDDQLGYPTLLPADRSAPVPHGQLPSLPRIFTRPPAQTLGPEHEWLDPQLLGQSSMALTVNTQNDPPRYKHSAWYDKHA